MLPTSGHMVLGSNPAHGFTVCHCTEPFIVTLPFSRYDLNNVERPVKHQPIIDISKKPMNE